MQSTPISRASVRFASRRWWILGICVVAVVLGALGLSKQASDTAQPEASRVRSVTIASGLVEDTIRLSGVTAAEHYASMVAPQLRGNRGGPGGPGGGGPSGSSAASSSTISVASLSSTKGTAGAAQSSAVGSSRAVNASAAFKAATSRTGGSAAAASPSSSSTPAATSATLGSDGLGSTSSGLPGGSQGPPAVGSGTGGGDDFMLVLQKLEKPGSMVKKGDILAEFDRQYMLNRLDDYRATVYQSEASLKSQRADIEITRKAHEQLIDSAKGALEKARLDTKTIPVLSAIDVERTKLALDEAEAHYKQLLQEVQYVQISEDAQIHNSELDLERAKIELKRAEANAEKMVVRAPISGLMVMQSIFRGGDFGQIQQGDQLWPGQSFVQIVDPASMVVNATVNQVDAERVRLGAKAHIRFDAYPDLELPARVESIAAITMPGRFRASFVKEVAVRLRIVKMDRRVIPDLSVSADVILESEQQEAVAPLASVMTAGGQSFVYLRRPSGWERQDVQLGLKNRVSLAVRSGLHPGDVVALEKPPTGAL